MDRATLLKQFDLLIAWLEYGDEERPELFGSCDEYEWLLRLSSIARSLLARHSTDAEGCCRRCRAPRKGVRGWIPHRRMSCQVLARAAFFATSELDVVWWQALSLRDDDITLDEVRAWLADEQPGKEQGDEPESSGQVWPTKDEDHGRHALLTDARVRLREEPRDDVRPYIHDTYTTARFAPATPFSDDTETEELPVVRDPTTHRRRPRGDT